jgi:hypothetical protein
MSTGSLRAVPAETPRRARKSESSPEVTYDAVIQGQHYARTILCTDILQQQNGRWTLMANHCSQAAK